MKVSNITIELQPSDNEIVREARIIRRNGKVWESVTPTGVTGGLYPVEVELANTIQGVIHHLNLNRP